MSSEMHVARDDRVLFKRRANHVQGRAARGGCLCATNKQLVFRPHLIERTLFRAQTLAIPWDEVREMTVAARAPASLLTGGQRKRLEVKRHDGSSELFVVNHVNELAEKLREIQGAVATTA